MWHWDAIITVNLLIDSISVNLGSTLDTSPRLQETGFTCVTYVDTSDIKILI